MISALVFLAIPVVFQWALYGFEGDFINNAYNMIPALVFLAIPAVFQWALYGFKGDFM